MALPTNMLLSCATLASLVSSRMLPWTSSWFSSYLDSGGWVLLTWLSSVQDFATLLTTLPSSLTSANEVSCAPQHCSPQAYVYDYVLLCVVLGMAMMWWSSRTPSDYARAPSLRCVCFA
eukprot:3431834-Amphidinium_carterae.1